MKSQINASEFSFIQSVCDNSLALYAETLEFKFQ